MKANVFSIYSDELRFVKPFMPKKGDEVAFSIKAYEKDFTAVKLVIYEDFSTIDNGIKNNPSESYYKVEDARDEKLINDNLNNFMIMAKQTI